MLLRTDIVIAVTDSDSADRRDTSEATVSPDRFAPEPAVFTIAPGLHEGAASEFYTASKHGRVGLTPISGDHHRDATIRATTRLVHAEH